MRITTNFVNRGDRAVIPVAATLWLCTIVFCTAAWWLVEDAASLRSSLPDLRQRLARVGTAAHGVPQVQNLPPVSELAEMRERVARINAAAQTKGVPTTALLAKLETLLPSQAWLLSFHHRATQAEVTLIAAAPTAEPLSGFLLKLEHDPLFEEVMLLRELSPTSSGKSVQYEIRLKVRS
jgi:Tfp pilus assembly protein PilN